MSRKRDPIDRFLQADPGSGRCFLQSVSQPQIVGIDEIDKARVHGLPDQRIDPANIHVIGNHRDISWIQPRPNRISRRCQRHGPGTKERNGFQSACHDASIAIFVIMRAALQIGDTDSLLNTDRELPRMTRDRHFREAQQILVGNSDPRNGSWLVWI